MLSSGNRRPANVAAASKRRSIFEQQSSTALSPRTLAAALEAAHQVYYFSESLLPCPLVWRQPLRFRFVGRTRRVIASFFEGAFLWRGQCTRLAVFRVLCGSLWSIITAVDCVPCHGGILCAVLQRPCVSRTGLRWHLWASSEGCNGVERNLGTNSPCFLRTLASLFIFLRDGAEGRGPSPE